MTIRDRNQNPILGDQIRLRSYVYTSGAQAAVPLITKVEVYKKTERLEDMSFNPNGKTIKKVIENHMLNGVWNEVQPYPEGVVIPDYYWTVISTNNNDWQEGGYYDWWYMIFDDTLSLENWLPNDTIRIEGTTEDPENQTTATNRRSFVIDPTQGKILTPGGIQEEESYTAMTLGTVSTNIQTEGWSAPPVGLLDVTATTVIFRVGQRNTTSWTERSGWIRCDTMNGTDWTCTTYSNGSALTGATVTMNTFTDSGLTLYKLNITFPSTPSNTCFVDTWNVDQWKITGITYDPYQPNPWDDIWERCSPSRRHIAKYEFDIRGNVFFTSPRPAIYDFNFTPVNMRLRYPGKGHLQARVTPVVSLPESEQYYRQFVDLGDATYKIWRVRITNNNVLDGEDLELIKEGSVTYREVDDLYVRIDTTQKPFQAGQFKIQFSISWRDIVAVSEKMDFIVVNG